MGELRKMKVRGRARMALAGTVAAGVATGVALTVSSAPVGAAPAGAAPAAAAVTAAVADKGGVYGWGFDTSRADGMGAVSPALPGPVAGLAGRVRQVVAGAGFSAALMTDGSVRTWGNGDNGARLGNG
jgi:hypothetical protein